MYKFFIWILIIIISTSFYKKYKCSWYFNYHIINKKYNLVMIEFLYYYEVDKIKKGKIIVPKDSSSELIEVLEECFLEKIIL